LDENLNTIKRKKQTLLDASMDVGLEVHAEKNKYNIMCHY